jgi:hypothetical protein
MKLNYTFPFLLLLEEKSQNNMYCNSFFKNDIKLSFNYTLNTLDLYAKFNNKKYECKDEKYKYNESSKSINISNDQNNCINKFLIENRLCPCPPELFFVSKKNKINIINSKLGKLTLHKCIEI